MRSVLLANAMTLGLHGGGEPTNTSDRRNNATCHVSLGYAGGQSASSTESPSLPRPQQTGLWTSIFCLPDGMHVYKAQAALLSETGKGSHGDSTSGETLQHVGAAVSFQHDAIHTRE